MSRILHKDMCSRVIGLGDFVVWASNRQGYGMQIGRVTGFAKKQIWITLVGTSTKKRLYPSNCIVITAQMHQNVEDKVGVETEPLLGTSSIVDMHPIPGQTAESWFEARGINVHEEGTSE